MFSLIHNLCNGLCCAASSAATLVIEADTARAGMAGPGGADAVRAAITYQADAQACLLSSI